jgi:hypothetical protein
VLRDSDELDAMCGECDEMAVRLQQNMTNFEVRSPCSTHTHISLQEMQEKRKSECEQLRLIITQKDAEICRCSNATVAASVRAVCVDAES